MSVTQPNSTAKINNIFELNKGYNQEMQLIYIL